MRRYASLFILTGMFLATGASAVNLVFNPSFESGNFDGWGASWSEGNPVFVPSNEEALSGQWSAKFDGAVGKPDKLEQVLNTSAGQSYTISMWVKNYGIEQDRLRIFWEGQEVADFDPVGTGLESWQYVSLNVQAAFNSSVFGFSGYDAQAAFYVDDVRVEAVPEPATMAVLAVGMLGVLRRRRISGH